METRFLVDDLKLTPKDPEPPKVPESGSATGQKIPEEKKSPLKMEAAPAPGGVSVSVNPLAKPGMIVSGKAPFSNRTTAAWSLAPTGSIGVIPAPQGYKPAPADVQEFQTALQSELAKMGFA